MENLKQFNTMASDDWRTQSFRQSMVARIEDVIQRSGLQMPRNSSEMENQVYMKATTREDYMSMIAKLILHVREMIPRQYGPTTNPADASSLKTYSSELKRMYSMSDDRRNSKKRKNSQLTDLEKQEIDVFCMLVAQKMNGLADANDRLTAQSQILEVFRNICQ